jgi:hypothetical protein
MEKINKFVDTFMPLLITINVVNAGISLHEARYDHFLISVGSILIFTLIPRKKND